MSIIELDERPSGDRMTFGIFAVLGAKRVATECCLLCNVIIVITDNRCNMLTLYYEIVGHSQLTNYTVFLQVCERDVYLTVLMILKILQLN